MTIIALIPARQNSKRLSGKNVYCLNGHPLLAYSIASALESGIFQGVYVSTDSMEYADIARHYGAEVIMRPARYGRDDSPDSEWIVHAISAIPLRRWTMGQKLPAPLHSSIDAFAILRPTSPFRTADTIRRAWEQYQVERLPLKAVEKVKQHPYKMWQTISTERAVVALPFMWPLGVTTAHLLPTQTLRPVYVQNGCIEIRPTEPLIDFALIEPFATEGYEGLDVNEECDIVYAEWLIEHGKAVLPEVKKVPYEKKKPMEELYAD